MKIFNQLIENTFHGQMINDVNKLLIDLNIPINVHYQRRYIYIRNLKHRDDKCVF